MLGDFELGQRQLGTSSLDDAGATTTRAFGQALAYIKGRPNQFAQANANILGATQKFSQAQADIKVTSNKFAQAQASISGLYESTIRADSPYGWWKLADASGLVATASIGPDGTYKSSGITYQTSVPMPVDDLFKSITTAGAGYMYTNPADDVNDWSVEIWTSPSITIQLPSESTSGITGGGTNGPNAGGQNYVWFPDNRLGDRGLGVSVGTNGINVYAHGNSNIYALASYSGTLSGAMHHIVVTVSSKQPKIYLDGVLVRTGLTETSTNAYRPRYVFGADSYGSYLGKANNPALYNGALSATQVLNHYQAGVPRAYGQARAYLATRTTVEAQAQADILSTNNGYGQTKGSVLQTYNTFGQAQSDIRATYQGYGQAQAFIVLSSQQYGQAQAKISGTYSIYGQANADILQVYQVYGQAQSTIVIATYPVGQSQAYIKARVNSYAQAQAEIVLTTYKFAQMQANIRAVYSAFAQVNTLINSLIKVNSGNVQARIVKLAGYGQATALIASPRGWGQVQAQIKRFKVYGSGQAMAFVLNRKKQGQAMASIKAKPRGYGQARSFITKLRGQGQAQAKILSFKTQKWAQAKAYINDRKPHAQAQASIITTKSVYGQSVARIKAKSNVFAQTQAIIVVKRNAFAQTTASILTIKNRSGQAMAHIIGNTGYGQAAAKIDGVFGVIIEDILANAHTYDLTTNLSYSTVLDLTGYGNDENIDPDGIYDDSSDGTWAREYNNEVPALVPEDIAPNGWMYFTVSEISRVRFDTLKAVYLTNDFSPDTVMEIWTGDSGPGNWTFIDGNDDTPYTHIFGGATTFQSKLELVLNAGTYLFQLGMYASPLERHTIFNINVTKPLGFGQVQARILQPNPYSFAQVQGLVNTGLKTAQAQATMIGTSNKTGQAQAIIEPRGIRSGQAQARIKKFGAIATGLAVGRILLDEGNESNNYQITVMDDRPDAYYTFGEPLLPGGLYEFSNMLYKDTVWDNVGLYDLRREYGIITYGPYGGATVGTYASSWLFLPSFTAYYAEPLGIPGTHSQTGILSKDEGHNGFNYLYRFGESSPINGSSYWTIEFWYKPLELPLFSGSGPIIRVGNKEVGDSGAISIQTEGDTLATYFGIGGGTANAGPSYAGLVVNTWYHVVLTSDLSTFTQTKLWINGYEVDSTSQILQPTVDTVFINSNPVTGFVYLLDQVALYDTEIFHPSIPDHYYAGVGYNLKFGQALAYILTPSGQGQAQATIFNPWAKGQAQASITVSTRKYAQAQAYIKGYNTGQAQAFILTGTRVFGNAAANISSPTRKYSQARAKVVNTKPTGQAMGMIEVERYLVSFNGYQLPGYAQQESIDSVARTKFFGTPFRDVSFTEYQGLENKNLSLRILVTGENYLDCKNQIELAGTLVRTKRNAFAPLYVGYYDRHFDALTKSIKIEASTSNIRTAEYSLEFECKPWLESPIESSLTGTTLVTTTGRTIDNGGWTPAKLRLSGTNITVSGYTDTGDFTGFISVSGTVVDLMVDTEAYEAEINGQNANGVMLHTDYQIYVGPGVTNFAITGASDCTITYHDRWYL